MFPNLMDNVNYFNAGVKNYKNADWDKAMKRFTDSMKANPDDKLCNHLHRTLPDTQK